ncbi:hypothetical protein [Plebeiibacterium marinum]|uniref:SPOR domain-containing protein n=1 Tax=Plebeiibacterium marinum TaxID=2992111 RepID=A0AAE3SJX2_9BACT|nr:hypothetical protein [Plebeiobacterium marinum]MCW3805959.1 hypothetical protein [Plebeiobacterium marinum]
MIKYYLGVLILLMGFSVVAQIQTEKKEYTPQMGLDYFRSGNYIEAQKVYQELLVKYPKDARYNFYMGICEVKNRSNISGAIKKLNYAKLKRVSKDVTYYLGRAHQLSYNFEEAISNYSLFVKNTTSSDKRIEKANVYIQECNIGKRITSKIYNLEVLEKTKVNKSTMLSQYHLAKDVGTLLRNGDFFESGVDPDNVMFETERGDVVYFSMESNDEDTLSIFKMVKLIDGWGESETVGAPVNSVYNDAYPFLATDGLTFYFASDRPGGLGGFDIYKAYYDNETNSFLDPINLGVPFNSPDDDFMFASDDFNEVAFFTSNRETCGDSLMVYKVRWNGRQVRNMVDDMNQVGNAARLSLSTNENTRINTSRELDDTKAKTVQRNKGVFQFEINDTLVYTQYEHFVSTEAKEMFMQGYAFDQEKDSLSSLLKQNRAKYSIVRSEVERNEIVNEILKHESKVYSLEDKIEEKYLYARQKELNEIISQIQSGTYKPDKEVEELKSKAKSIEGILIPEKYSMFTSEEFDKHYSKNKEMYKQLFSDNDIKTLRYADSLYVWANILNLESSQLLARSTQVEEDNSIKLNRLIKKENENTEEPEESKASSLIKESKELKILSTRIYHKALDKKYPVYWLKLKDISGKVDEGSGKEIFELTYQGNAYFREAKRELSTLGGLNIESFEKAGAMKRAGIESQENALNLYCSMIKDGFQVIESKAKETKGTIQKSYSEIHKGNSGEEVSEVIKEVEQPKAEKQEVSVVEKTKEVALIEEYKVQIGVFRNQPSKEALAKIPAVSSIELKGRGLTKYFSGSYKTRQEALEIIPVIVEAGFPGAFVVYFKNGVQSSIPKE